MKRRVLFSGILLLPLIHFEAAHSASKPVVESFKFTPAEIDLATANTRVEFELIVSHPNGIEEFSSTVTLSNVKGDNLSTIIRRTDNPVNVQQTKVIFKGDLILPLGVPTGVYNIVASELNNNNLTGYRYSTGLITPNQSRNIVGAETGLLIRNNGDLNLSYTTFVGPTHDRTLQISYNNPALYSAANSPIFKVGETYNPIRYYELRVPTLNLSITSTTPTVCESTGKELKFVSEGNCTFTVSTPKTKDYAARSNTQNVTVTSARTKPKLFVGTIGEQSAKNLPLKIPLTWVYGPADGYVMPKSETPTVCLAAGLFVNVISGGTCVLTYQSEENSSYLASDLYKITFEIVRDPQTVTFALPSTANVSTRSIALTATASSDGAITYSTTSVGICSITGSTLNLLGNGNCAVTATQAGTSKLAPASTTATVVLSGAVVATRKTINCVKGKSTKRVSGVNPKCPRGFKIKR
jgi:hypothetical protein